MFGRLCPMKVEKSARVAASPISARSSNFPFLCVVRIDIAACRRDYLEYKAVLSDSETEKSQTYFCRDDCARFVVTRGVMRFAISSLTNVQPDIVEIRSDSFGKPFVAGADSRRSPWEVNASHSGEYALLAFCLGSVVGIDVELVRELPDLDDIAAACLSRSQLRVFRELDRQDRIAAFYRSWTRKEALLKASGLGLSVPLKCVDVGLGSGVTGFSQIPETLGVTSNWSLFDIPVADGYFASLVTSHGPTSYDLMDWNGTEHSLKYFNSGM